MITLRPYQEKSRHWVNSQLNQGNNPLLVIPTGGGKSPTSSKIAGDRILLGKKLLVLVPQFELFNQMMNDYSHLNPGYINDEGLIGRNRNIYICMVQSLSNILNILPEKFCKSINEIIIDEAHFSAAQSWVDVYNHFNHCLRFGMTATPFRLDNAPLSEYFDTMYEAITISECIEKGYLCKPIIIIPDEYKDHIPDLDNYNKNDQKEFIQDKKIIGDMLKVYKDVFDGLPVIVPCASHKHAVLVTEMYNNAGWKVDHIHSKMNKTDRKIIINSVKNGKTNILVTVGVGVFGLNIVGLMGIIWLRYTESLVIFMQLNGRAMRIMEGKKYFVFVDPVGNSVIHGRPDIDRKWSLHTDYEPGQDNDEKIVSRICPVCSVVNSLQNTKCWICEYDFILQLDADGNEVDKKVRKLPKFVNGELVFLDGDNNGNNNNLHNDNTFNNREFSNSDKRNNDMDKKQEELTKAEKVEILKRDLTGLRMKTKFKDGVKWL